MTNRNKIRNRKRISCRTSDRRVVVKSAKAASRDAKRSSNALDLEYKIIKDGNIYSVLAGKMVKISTVPKIQIGKSGLTKGSKICLK